MSADPIPHLIHQTWKSDEVPEAWASYQQTWRHHHPGWEYRLWTDRDNEAFVREEFPELWPLYESLPFAIQRVDTIRYLILLRLGGLYADLDTECLQPFDSLTTRPSFIAAEEPETHAEWARVELMVSNAIMLAPPGHPLLYAVLERVAAAAPGVYDHRGVLTSTGPGMLGEVAHDYDGDDVEILDPISFCPFVSSEDGRRAFEERRRAVGDEQLRAEGVMAIHHFGNSWVGTLAGELVNPDPHGVEGYVFIAGYDSPGNDITNRGREIVRLAAQCNASEAVAFNTDGYLKGSVAPPPRWQHRPDWGDNEGLYLSHALYEQLSRDFPELGRLRR